MAQINRFPKGLLPLLDAKTMGRTPAETDPRLQFGLDLSQFYQFDIPLEDEAANSVTVNAVGEYCRITVPNLQAWLVERISGTLTAVGAAPTSAAIALRVGATGVSQMDYDSSAPSPLVAVGNSVTRGVEFNRPKLFAGGSFFAIRNCIALAGNQRMDLVVHFRRLSV